MNLIGFLNRSRSFPAPLISVVRDGEDFFVVYPSGDKVRLTGVQSEQAVKDRDSFIAIPRSGVNGVPELAFGVAPGLVFAGDQKAVAGALRTYVAKGPAPLLDVDEAAAIKDFLLSINEYVGKLSVRELFDVMNGRRCLSVRITNRQLRRRNKQAKRLVVQVRGRGHIKTLYRKNIPHGLDAADVPVPSNTVWFLQQQANLTQISGNIKLGVQGVQAKGLADRSVTQPCVA